MAEMAYRYTGSTPAVELRFAPSCLDQHVCRECFFDGFNLAHFDEHDLNENRLLILHNDNDLVVKARVSVPLKILCFNNYCIANILKLDAQLLLNTCVLYYLAICSINPSINQSISDLYDGAIIRREGGESEAPG